MVIVKNNTIRFNDPVMKLIDRTRISLSVLVIRKYSDVINCAYHSLHSVYPSSDAWC